jgi:hypothetical protein
MSNLPDKIYETIRWYTCSNMEDEHNEGYPAVDLFTPDNETIDKGEEEIRILADEIIDELADNIRELHKNEFTDSVSGYNQALDDVIDIIRGLRE